jgi:hypothetical protein
MFSMDGKFHPENRPLPAEWEAEMHLEVRTNCWGLRGWWTDLIDEGLINQQTDQPSE